MRRAPEVNGDGEGAVRLADGRELAWAEFGDPAGRPACYFHGSPGCRYEGRLLDDAARRNNVRLIAIDRPGYGRSTFLPGRQFSDWPADVSALADALGIGRFAVIGLSGGGPHALACARSLAGRLTSVTVVSGAGTAAMVPRPKNRLLRAVFRAGERVARLLTPLAMRAAAFGARHLPAALAPRWVDRRVMGSAAAREAFRAEMREAFRQGTRGAVYEYSLFNKPWAFGFDEITMQVHLWHGDADRVVPIDVGRAVAAALPKCDAHWIAGGGHLMLVEIADDVLRRV